MSQNYSSYRAIPFKKRTHCLICRKPAKQPVIELPGFPLTEVYVAESPEENLGYVDQQFQYCDHCGHGQLANVIDPKVLYGDTYVTRTSSSASAIDAIQVFIGFINGILGDLPIDNIVEVGCNDLYTLQQFRGRTASLIGIDPILAKSTTQLDLGVKVIGDFVENLDFKKLDLRPHVVLCSHTLEHLEDPSSTIRKLLDSSNENTLFFFQFPGLEKLVEDAAFDQVFHQHLNYFSLQSVCFLLDQLGGELIDYRFNSFHYGALMIAFRKKRSKSVSSMIRFSSAFGRLSAELIRKQYALFVDTMKLANQRIESYTHETIYGYGAALMLPIQAYYIPALLKLKCIIDDDPNKRGKYYLNVPLQIFQSSEIENLENSTVVVTAINSRHAIRSLTEKLIRLRVKNIIVPSNLL